MMGTGRKQRHWSAWVAASACLTACSGALAELYETMGGRVAMAGKPFAAIYDLARKRAAEALGILRAVLVRCAQAGVLAADVDLAAQTIMSANVGVTLSLVTQPKAYDNRALAVGTGGALVEKGGDTWFLVTADYAFGH